MSQDQLAKRIEKSQNAISRYENGESPIPANVLPAIAEALDVPYAYFFRDDCQDEEIMELVTQLAPPFRSALLPVIRSLRGWQRFLFSIFGNNMDKKTLDKADDFVKKAIPAMESEIEEIFANEMRKRVLGNWGPNT